MRYRARLVQRHQGRRHHRVVRATREAADLIRASRIAGPPRRGGSGEPSGKLLRRAARGLFGRGLIAAVVGFHRTVSVEWPVVVGVLVADLLLGDVRSLKEKRAVVRPIVAELRRRFEVAAAETGDQELYRRAELAVSVVSGEHRHVVEVLDGCERMLAARPEIELLSTRRRLLDDDDLD